MRMLIGDHPSVRLTERGHELPTAYAVTRAGAMLQAELWPPAGHKGPGFRWPKVAAPCF